ncbi:aconitate hydratase AcnA [Desulfogranum mediterraneum]|uniref:aconitate hydratase AcnA n=1 Tax=Desulfogranum mediterraneum TaxID=160661 RepID=UPI000414F97F|nr:aconitate hydratase AcnA [Desulfogranum mediterraneum]
MSPQINFSQLDLQQEFSSQGKPYTFYGLQFLAESPFGPLSRYPFSIRILLENLLRYLDQGLVREEDFLALAAWRPGATPNQGIPFMPSRVVLQDFTGVPALVDLAALRSALARKGGDPTSMNPFIPADLVIDHSIQVDRYGSTEAFDFNVRLEMERNRERYTMLHWGQQAFANFRVVPPGTGIVHQVNLEYLASVAQLNQQGSRTVVSPDTVLGTDSHTTMINGLGVVGWGVGGIEAEAVLLGQPYILQIPEVIGMRLSGSLPVGTTATDLVLTITRFLREKGVVGRFVEFFGPALDSLRLPDRATIANMAPEYGATMGFFPVDRETLRYLHSSGRDQAQVRLVEDYCRAAGLFYGPETVEPEYSTIYELCLDEVVPSLSGPRKPQELLPISQVKGDFGRQFAARLGRGNGSLEAGNMDGCPSCAKTPVACSLPTSGCDQLDNGSVVIAAITSCTNTSNPDVMIGAGLLARNAVKRGLRCKPWVKTSMAPGSRVVSRYLEESKLLADLETLGFHVVGYGCTTCIGNSGPLDETVATAIERKGLITAAVLSGNRNFEARIHPQVQANYLGSPMLVIAYGLAGSVLSDPINEPLGKDDQGRPVFLRDIWPSQEEIRRVVDAAVTPELFSSSYQSLFKGDQQWNSLHGGSGQLFPWDPDSSYIQEPPFFTSLSKEVPPIQDIHQARILAIFGDTITTDHISPAGAIPADSPAGQYLQSLGIAPQDFNSYGSRRGNHQVMMRGTFANIRIRNTMVEREGGYTLLLPQEEETSIYEAAIRYQQSSTPLVIFAGKDYGTGSSRDWAAKGTMLLGVKAVVATSFERIHRSNLVGMGVLPLQFAQGTDATSLGLTGRERISITALEGALKPGAPLQLQLDRADGSSELFSVLLRLDNDMEIDYYRHGGILHKVLRQRLNQN